MMMMKKRMKMMMKMMMKKRKMMMMLPPGHLGRKTLPPLSRVTLRPPARVPRRRQPLRGVSSSPAHTLEKNP